jgi:hypothetical protein
LGIAGWCGFCVARCRKEVLKIIYAGVPAKIMEEWD